LISKPKIYETSKKSKLSKPLLEIESHIPPNSESMSPIPKTNKAPK